MYRHENALRLPIDLRDTQSDLVRGDKDLVKLTQTGNEEETPVSDLLPKSLGKKCDKVFGEVLKSHSTLRHTYYGQGRPD